MSDARSALPVAFRTDLGQLYITDCVTLLAALPDASVDVITSPPYDGQPRYGDGERYDREWYKLVTVL